MKKRSLSVFHLLPTLGRGGAEQVVMDLATRLPAEGVKVTVIAIIDGGPLEEQLKVRGIPYRIFHRRSRFGFDTLRDLYQLFQRERPDVVHTHLFGADAWGRLAAFIARVPVVVTTEHNVNPTYTRLQHGVNRLFARWTDALIAVSREVKRATVESEKIPAERIRVIGNGVDVERISVRPVAPFHDVPRLMTVGRLYPQKDHATLLRACADVNHPWRLDVIGGGPLERELRHLVEKCGIASRVRWLGVRDDVYALYAGADIFCFPSRWEGLGLAPLEAALAGVPLIVSDIPPLRELFQEDEAVFVEPGSVTAWTLAIEHVIAHPAEALERARRARARLARVAGSEQMAKAYARVYDACLKRV